MQTETLSVVIPALNEAESLLAVINELSKISEIDEILVVDDASTDSTPDIVREYSLKDKRLRVISHTTRSGNGAAVKTGLAAVKGKWTAVLDADGQHPPALIPKMLNQVVNEHLDLTIAARDFKSSGGGTPRTISNKFLSSFASFLFKVKIPDITSGYRIGRTDLFRRFHRLYPDGFSFPLTSTISFILGGYRVGFLLYEGISRKFGTSNISWYKDGNKFVVMLFRLMLWKPLRITLWPSLLLLVLGILWTIRTVIINASVSAGGVLLLMLGLSLLIGGIILQQIMDLRLDVLAWLDSNTR